MNLTVEAVMSLSQLNSEGGPIFGGSQIAGRDLYININGRLSDLHQAKSAQSTVRDSGMLSNVVCLTKI